MTDVHHKIFCNLVEEKGKPSLIVPKIVVSQAHNLWKHQKTETLTPS